MKNIITICAFLFGLNVFAQEAGRVGELLKSETISNNSQVQRGSETASRNDKGSRGRNNRQGLPINNNDYRWHYTQGNAEVFLRIPENGNFTVEIGDQMISNGTGKFRFFDLRAGDIPIAIYENNYLLYKTRLVVLNNTRTVLDFFSNHGLYLLGNYPLQPNWYGANEWDDIWNNPYNNQNSNWNPNNGNVDYYGNVMDSREFDDFIASIERNASFDKDKIAMISSVARNSSFFSKQIQSLVGTMSFDKGKLEVAKVLYGVCVDKPNFYQVYDSFDFDASKRELSEYISRTK